MIYSMQIFAVHIQMVISIDVVKHMQRPIYIHTDSRPARQGNSKEESF